MISVDGKCMSASVADVRAVGRACGSSDDTYRIGLHTLMVVWLACESRGFDLVFVSDFISDEEADR